MSLKTLRRRIGKALYLSRTPSYRDGLKLGIAAAIEHEGPIRSIEYGTLIDVGANLGQFSLLSRTLHPDAVIHAFEPLSAMAVKYQQLFASDARTTLHRCAAGTFATTAEINVSNHPDSSSLLPISNQQSELFPGTQKSSVEVVKVERIDDVLRGMTLPDPILIKLDVQGFELEALKGMPDLLARARWVYVEVSFMELYVGQPLASEICAWLKEQAFDIAGVYNPTFSDEGVNIQADLLFARCV